MRKNASDIAYDEKRKACNTCEKFGKGTHNYSEEQCWYKSKINNQERKSFIKHVNNSVVKAEVINTDTKNEYSHQ